MKKMNPTSFQIDVWNQIKKIPKGETKSYKEIAIAIGNPKAFRAVANACGKNPNPIIVPCHRVIASDGSIGGYTGLGGRTTKRRLLANEGVIIE
jgi:methylated-DNA-[protein]-cysteine S-methyltransferase